MLIKKRYLMILSLTVISALLGSMFYITQAQKGKEPTISKDFMEITLLDVPSNKPAFGVNTYEDYVATLPFVFNPQADFLNVTDLWITLIAYGIGWYEVKFDVTVNGLTTTSNITRFLGDLGGPRIITMHMGTPVCETINSGINILVLSNAVYYDGYWLATELILFKVSVFIEYTYQPR